MYSIDTEAAFNFLKTRPDRPRIEWHLTSPERQFLVACAPRCFLTATKSPDDDSQDPTTQNAGWPSLDVERGYRRRKSCEG